MLADSDAATDHDLPATFEPYGPSHVLALVVLGIACVSLGVAMHDRRRREAAAVGAGALGIVLVAHELLNVGLHWGVYGYPWQENLPLNFCRANMWVSAWMLLKRSYRAYEIAYFWAIVGAGTALVAPALTEAFPHPLYFTFFFGHGIAIVAVLYATWVLDFAPRLRSLAVSLIAALALAAVAAAANRVLGTNYLYLSAPPEGSMVVDVFGRAYLAGVTATGLVAAFLSYLPFVRHERRLKRNA
jgi:hypothetical integral membrane protein (TIGR02206 family)